MLILLMLLDVIFGMMWFCASSYDWPSYVMVLSWSAVLVAHIVAACLNNIKVRGLQASNEKCRHLIKGLGHELVEAAASHDTWASWLQSQLDTAWGRVAELEVELASTQQQLRSAFEIYLADSQRACHAKALQVQDLSNQLAPFQDLLQEFKVSTAADLGAKLRGFQSTCRKQAVVIVMMKGGWRATRTELSTCRTLLVESRLDSSAKDTQLVDLHKQLAPFQALVQDCGVSTAAELGGVIKDTQATCKQQAAVAVVLRGLWRSTRGKLAESRIKLSVSQKSSAGYEAWSEELYADWMAAENNTAAVTKSFLRVKGLYLEVLKSHRGLHERFVTLQTKHSQLAADFQALQCQTKGSKSLTEQHGVTEEVHTAYVQQQEDECAGLVTHLQSRLSTTSAALSAQQATSSNLAALNTLLQQQVAWVQDQAAADAAEAGRTLTVLGIVVQQLQVAMVDGCCGWGQQQSCGSVKEPLCGLQNDTACSTDQGFL